MGRKRIWRAESGTATVEFVGLIPGLLLVALVAAQFLVAGFSLWSASTAARAGARAAHVGTDPRRAARDALPGLMREGAQVGNEGGAVTARIRVPRVLPFLPVFEVEAKSGLGAGG